MFVICCQITGEGYEGIAFANEGKKCALNKLFEEAGVVRIVTVKPGLTGSLELEDVNTLDDIVLAMVVGGVSVDSSPDDMTEGMVLSLLST